MTPETRGRWLWWTWVTAMAIVTVSPTTRIPIVRPYDMFASPTPDPPLRTLFVVHYRNGTKSAHPPFGMLPLEAVRTSSLAIEALWAGPEAARQFLRESIKFQKRGWRRFDQIWPPILSPELTAQAVCLHRVTVDAVDTLLVTHGEQCPTMVEVGAEA